MFEILLFLFRHYPSISGTPNRQLLANKLDAAGFEQGDIEQVLNWLGDLDSMSAISLAAHAEPAQPSIRCYTMEEQHHLGIEGMNFLMFLQQNGIINTLQREWIIQQAMRAREHDDPPIMADIMTETEDGERDESLRWIALMVIWHQHPDQNIVVLEDMLFQQHAMPTLH